jgi:hypothetical protein
MKCEFCSKEIVEGITSKDNNMFCNQDCLESFYMKKISNLENSVTAWKKAWFDYRDLVGQYGYKYCIPDSYKF